MAGLDRSSSCIMALSTWSPYRRVRRKRATPPVPSRIMPHQGMVNTELPTAADTSSPQGRPSTTRNRNRRKETSVSPAIMQRRSSGKKGKRKARKRNTSRFLRMISPYRSQSFPLTKRRAKRCPRFRLSWKTTAEPRITAAVVMRKDPQHPKSSPPATVVRLLGMGATRQTGAGKRRRGNRGRSAGYIPASPLENGSPEKNQWSRATGREKETAKGQRPKPLSFSRYDDFHSFCLAPCLSDNRIAQGAG